MKWSILIASLALVVASSQKSVAQKKDFLSLPYHASVTEGTVRSFLEEMNLKTGYTIEYSSIGLGLDNTIHLSGRETTIGSCLQKILIGQKVKLLEKNHKIILATSPFPINVNELVPAYNVYGFVKTSTSKEPLMEASIADLENQQFMVSNTYGYYSFRIAEGDHRIKISYTGFSEKIVDISLHGNMRLDFEMEAGPALPEVVIKNEDILRKTESNKVPGDVNPLYNYFLGENDPVRSVYLFPGVISVPQNFSSLLVRGGGPDENLFLLDGTQVYNPSHMLGALSIVNQTALRSLQFYKSDFPAKFSGSLSSVIDVYTKDGDMNNWHGEASLGVLSGAFTVEGPLVKNKTAIMGSFRHSWPTPFWNTLQNNLAPNFYDADFKLTQMINRNNKLMLNVYSGGDQISQYASNTNNLHKSGNLLGSLTWNHLLGAKSFINATVNYSEYQNTGGYKYTLLDDQAEEVQSRSLGTHTSMAQYNARMRAEFYISEKTRLNAGLQYNHSMLTPFESKITRGLEDDNKGFTTFQVLPFNEFSGYAEWEYKPWKWLFLKPGLHLSYYQFRDYQYISPQPRLFANFQISPRNRFFFAYSRMTQYLHLVTNPYLGLDANIWLPSTSKLTPQQSESFTIGYAYTKKSNFTAGLAAYWKQLNHVTNYANGKSYFINSGNWEQNIESGKGWSYGLEWMSDLNLHHISFHASYTLSWNWRQFPDINNGEKFPYKYDRRHALNIGVAWNISKHVDASCLWSFSTGDAVSLPDYIYPDFDQAQQITNPDDLLKNYRFTYQFTAVNQYRTANYQRVDASLSYHSVKERKWRSTFTAGVYNINGSPDQYSYDLLGSINTKNLVVETKSNYYGMIPYVSYTLKF